MNERITEFAKKQGYRGAEHSGTWNGYEIYEPTFGVSETSFVGLPYVILAYDDKIRMSTSEEAFAYLATLPD